MRKLKSIALPDVDHGSGSIAFDGQALWYGPGPVTSAIGPELTTFRRVDARTGHALPPLDIPVRGVTALLVDLVRGTYYAQAFVPAYHPTLDPTGSQSRPATAGMYEVDLRRNTVHKLFSLDPANATDLRIGYDSTQQEFIVSANEDNYLRVLDRFGKLLSKCTLPIKAGSGQGAASLTSTGDGGLFVQLEDDITMVQTDTRCRNLDERSHELYYEAHDENDQLTCDTVTFRRPAIWLRDISSDGKKDGITAYEVRAARCPLPTALTLRAPRKLIVGQPLTVCADLSLASTRAPLPGLAVGVRTQSLALRPTYTSKSGVACSTWRPTQPGKLQVSARWAGDVSYLASEDDAQVTVLAAPFTPPNKPAPKAVAPAPASGGQPPAPVAQGQPAPAGQIQGQPAPQGAPQGQPMVAAVPQLQPQVQVQVQTQQVPQSRGLLEQAMSRRGGNSVLVLGGGVLIAALVISLAAATQPRHAVVRLRGGRP